MLGLLLTLALTQAEPPPEGPVPGPPAAVPQSVVQRGVFEGLAAVGATGAALGISLAFTLANPRLDAAFTNAALGALLMTGVGFAVHELLGGRGEITLALLGSVIAMGLAALAANAIDQTAPLGPVLCTALGAVPGAALVTLALELTTPKVRAPLKIALSGTGFALSF